MSDSGPLSNRLLIRTIRLTRGLAGGTLRFEPDDVVRVKVFPVYVSLLYNRDRYLSLFGQHAHAVEAFQGARCVGLNTRATAVTEKVGSQILRAP